MKRWSALNDRQASLLKRVADGDEISGPESLPERQSAYALSGRGLIEVSKRGGVFRAKMTGAGRFYLAEGRYPDQPTQFAAIDSLPTAPPRRRPPDATVATSARRLAEATKLLEQLAAERKVIVVKPTEDEVVAWRKVIDFAKRHGLVPDGHRIEKFTTWNKDLQISLVAGAHPNTGRTALLADGPITRVPDSLRQCNPVVARLRDNERRMTMPKDQRRRGLLLLQAVAVEAEQRGYTVRDHRVSPYASYDTASLTRAGTICVVIDGFDSSVAVAQVSPEAADLERRELLAIEVPSYRVQGRQIRWVDGKRRKAEDNLSFVFKELELQAAEAAKRKIDEDRAEETRRHQRDTAMAKAKASATLAFYVRTLEKQHKQWCEAERLREYLAALEVRLAHAVAEDDPDIEKAREWLTFVKTHVTNLDPLTTVPTMPDAPSWKNEDLRPYLGGQSPFGPN